MSFIDSFHSIYRCGLPQGSIERQIETPTILRLLYATLTHLISLPVDNLPCKHIAIMTVATQVTGPTEGRSKFKRLYNFVGFKKRYNFFLCK
jgi:hypothetical protein